jgi:hypothetical protein
MKHAGPATLAQLADLLEELRKRPALRERNSGTFYVKSKAFLHFHEDPAGLFADVKLDFVEFTRHPVTTSRQQHALLTRIDRCLTSVVAG